MSFLPLIALPLAGATIGALAGGSSGAKKGLLAGGLAGGVGAGMGALTAGAGTSVGAASGLGAGGIPMSNAYLAANAPQSFGVGSFLGSIGSNVGQSLATNALMSAFQSPQKSFLPVDFPQPESNAGFKTGAVNSSPYYDAFRSNLIQKTTNRF